MKRHLWAFLKVPLIAAASWHVLMMVEITVVNGRLRLMTDVLAFAFGAAIYGVVAAAVITAVLALPAYLVFHRLGLVSLASAIGAGVAIGVLYSWVAYRVGEALPMGVWVGPLVGLVSAVAWWHLAGRPGGRQPGDGDLMERSERRASRA